MTDSISVDKQYPAMSTYAISDFFVLKLRIASNLK